jgi:hypothetical protein
MPVAHVLAQLGKAALLAASGPLFTSKWGTLQPRRRHHSTWKNGLNRQEVRVA